MAAESLQLRNIPQLQWLQQQTPLKLEWTPGLHAAARKAAREGNIAVLHTLLTHSGFHHWNGADGGKAHYCSHTECKGGLPCTHCICVLDFCLQTLQVYKAAATSGQLPVLARLFGAVHLFSWDDVHDRTSGLNRYLSCYNPAHSLDRRLLTSAAAAGQLPVIEWMHNEIPPALWTASLPAAIEAAARAGKLPVISWLQHHSAQVSWTAEFTTSAAAGEGQLDMLKWLCLECTPPCPVDETTMARAASSGSLETMQFLRLLSPPCPMDDSATTSAVFNN
ncbi:hypothetical protein WJX74_003326 [Apatococcus lobatus]|uniref:SWIM-type domain-containing protein n=1 Tax=Apatococcus lobatus TaxID=904363 RepID=A0AAW1QUU2_9CHLO